MVSYDVCSLFTNVPIEETLKIIKIKLQEDNDLKSRTKLSVEAILTLIEICVNNCYFPLEEKFYNKRQVYQWEVI